MKASEQQIGGNHYKDNFEIQPSEFIQRNKLGWCEGNAVKYACRHHFKNGRQDIEKAIHYLNLLLEWQYPITAADFPPLHPAEAAAISEDMAGGCPVCGEQMIGKPRGCGKHGIPSAGTVREIDFSLPSIVLAGDEDDCRLKYNEEYNEWRKSATGSNNELVEAWDRVQSAATWVERAKNMSHVSCASTAYTESKQLMKIYANEGRPVLESKAACLVKNAARNYYAPITCQKILASEGKSWR